VYVPGVTEYELAYRIADAPPPPYQPAPPPPPISIYSTFLFPPSAIKLPGPLNV
jgi:hypothetical protein